MAGVCPVSSEAKNYYRPAPPSPDLYVVAHLLIRLQFSEDPLLLLDVLPSLCDVWGEVSSNKDIFLDREHKNTTCHVIATMLATIRLHTTTHMSYPYARQDAVFPVLQAKLYIMYLQN